MAEHRRWSRHDPPRFEPIIIAIDGPAAAGKGTLARRLAQHFNLPYSTPACSTAPSPAG